MRVWGGVGTSGETVPSAESVSEVLEVCSLCAVGSLTEGGGWGA